MKIFNNVNQLTGAVLATLACASFLGCSRNSDREVMNGVPSTTVASAPYDTTSNTTVAANDETAPPPMDASAPAAMPDDSASKPEASAKPAKHMKSKHKMTKKHKKADSAWVAPKPVIDDDAYAYNSNLDNDVTNDDAVVMQPELSSVDATADYDDTVSGMTQPPTWRESGLSPFAQEPFSRLPIQIGSGQLSGQDKSTTILDGPSLFQDPAALNREFIH